MEIYGFFMTPMISRIHTKFYASIAPRTVRHRVSPGGALSLSTATGGRSPARYTEAHSFFRRPAKDSRARGRTTERQGQSKREGIAIVFWHHLHWCPRY